MEKKEDKKSVREMSNCCRQEHWQDHEVSLTKWYNQKTGKMVILWWKAKVKFYLENKIASYSEGQGKGMTAKDYFSAEFKGGSSYSKLVLWTGLVG